MNAEDIKQACDLLHDFFNEGRNHSFNRRSVIIDYHSTPRNAYLITSGKVRISSYSRTGQERILYLYKENELFPATYIFTEKLFNIAFIAHTDVTVKQRSIGDVYDFFTANPRALLAVVHQQMDVFNRLMNVALDTAEEKIAHRLLTYCDRFGKCEGERTILDFGLTIKDLGDSVKLSRETTGRIIKKFEENNMLVMGRHHLVVYPEKLATTLGD